MPVARVLGSRKRIKGASVEAWHAIESMLSVRLPVEYKTLVDEYGDAMIFGHLYLPHPEGNKPLSKFLEDRKFREAEIEYYQSVPDRVRQFGNLMVPWCYHSWDGDMGYLMPPGGEWESWSVVIELRQESRFVIHDVGVDDFILKLSDESRFMPTWPRENPSWRSIPESFLI
ncbi:SMI1/KNR4 family protein [Streptomyces smaragdinus]|uniref:SMI1/KNR4 family protein n=1 Tax=Streptomyces smaragdinus TaxID=2585196 RepID=UPI00129527E3|nr:SMI1/KNR4 family protein [Streptomyces smaragdinus]